MTKKDSSVNHPKHYLKKTGYEVINVIHAWKLGFALGNAIKYIARAGKKDPEKLIEDLEKAIWYINWKIMILKGEKTLFKIKVTWSFEDTEFEELQYEEARMLASLPEYVELEFDEEEDDVDNLILDEYGFEALDYEICD